MSCFHYIKGMSPCHLEGHYDIHLDIWATHWFNVDYNWMISDDDEGHPYKQTDVVNDNDVATTTVTTVLQSSFHVKQVNGFSVPSLVKYFLGCQLPCCELEEVAGGVNGSLGQVQDVPVAGQVATPIHLVSLANIHFITFYRCVWCYQRNYLLHGNSM